MLNHPTAFEAARAGVAYVPQGREVFPMMSVMENLETGFACLPREAHGVPDEILSSSRCCARWQGGAGATCPAASNSSLR